MAAPAHVARRTLLTATASLAVSGTVGGRAAAAGQAPARVDQVGHELRQLEQRYHTRLGVYAHNVRTGRQVHYRSTERFPILSVFKTLAAALVLRDFDRRGEVLDRRVHYTAADLVENSPITAQHVATGMTVAELCAAAICYSDNTAGNLILRITGGPRSVTRFSRSIGDRRTRLDRWEPDLNSACPGDLRDTTTPTAIGRSYGRLVLGDELRRRDRRQLTEWLLANTTSSERFKAGLPAHWALADKTGAGGYGSRNDVGIAWTATGTPIVLAALSVKQYPDAIGNNALLADVARLLAARLAPDER